MRWIRLLATGVFGLAVYPVTANLVLASGGVQKAVASSTEVKVEFARAWSFWPGQVHVEGFRLTMQDRNVQVLLEIPNADVRIRLTDLLHRTLHVTRTRASGVVFRFRHRIQPESAHLPYVVALPSIPGCQDPPLRESGPPTAPLDDAHYNMWTVHMEDVDVGVSEIWGQMFRYRGEARARGAFRLRPAKELWVGPADLAFHDGLITTGPHNVLRDLAGVLTCQIDNFDTRSATGMVPFHFISARLTVNAEVPSLQGANFLWGHSAPGTLDDGSGRIDTNVAIDHGIVSAESRVSYRTSHVGVAGAIDARIDGDVQLNATGTRAGGLQLVAQLSGARVQLDDHSVPPVVVDATGSLATDNADLTEDWPFSGAQIELQQAILPDLRWVNGLPFKRSKSLTIDGGKGQVSGAFTISPNLDVTGIGSVHVHQASGRAGDLRWLATSEITATFQKNAHRDASVEGRIVSGPYRIANAHGLVFEGPHAEIEGEIVSSELTRSRGDVRLRDWTGATGDIRIAGSSLVGKFAIDPDGAQGTLIARHLHAGAMDNGSCPWAEIKSATVNVDLATPPNRPTIGTARGDLDRVGFRWGALTSSAAASAITVQWNGAQTSAHLTSTGVRLKNAGGAPKSWQAEVTSLDMGTVLTTGLEVKGPARIELTGTSGQAGRARFAGNLLAEFQIRSADKAHRIADISGVIRTRDVTLSSRQYIATDWWANFTLDHLHLDTRNDFDFNGKLRAQFRDGLPALYVLASEDKIPKWIPTLLPLAGLTLDLEVERFCRWADVRIIGATGGPLIASGRVQVEPGETRGAVLIRLAALEAISLGLTFVEDYSDTSVLAGNRWLEQHLAPLVRAAAAKHNDRCEQQAPHCE